MLNKRYRDTETKYGNGDFYSKNKIISHDWNVFVFLVFKHNAHFGLKYVAPFLEGFNWREMPQKKHPKKDFDITDLFSPFSFNFALNFFLKMSKSDFDICKL